MSQVVIKNPGKFIVFEGLDGSGKTTQAKLLTNNLIDKGKITKFTKEPTENINHYLKEYQNLKNSELLAYLIDREQHLKIIDPEILSGVNYVCDRFSWSTLAYQDFSTDTARQIYLDYFESFALEPDLYIYLDASIEQCLKHVETRSKKSKYETYENLCVTQQKYKQLIDQQKKIDPKKILVVEMNSDLVVVEQFILTEVLNRLF